MVGGCKSLLKFSHLNLNLIAEIIKYFSSFTLIMFPILNMYFIVCGSREEPSTGCMIVPSWKCMQGTLPRMRVDLCMQPSKTRDDTKCCIKKIINIYDLANLAGLAQHVPTLPCH